MLDFHSARGFLALIADLEPPAAATADMPMPVPLGTVLWQARQSALSELLMTRNSEFGSMFSTCGLWQLPHSTLPLNKRTAPVASWVEGGFAPSDGQMSGAGWSGMTKLNGCVLCKLVPRSAVVLEKLPAVGTWPQGVSVPIATVPSWQLRHSVLFDPSGGDAFVLLTMVALVYT